MHIKVNDSMEPIQTERLLVRDFNENDWQSVHDYASDPEVVRYMEWGPNTEEETKNFIQRTIPSQKEQPRQKYTLAIILRDDTELIGSGGIKVSNPNNLEAEVGYCLNRQFWGRGYATEVGKALLRFGFEKLNLHRIFATSDPENKASVHVLENIGMNREGRLREHKWIKGTWCDSYLYAILDREWTTMRMGDSE